MIKLTNGLSFNIIYNSGSLGFIGNGWFYQKPFIWLNILPIKNIPKITKTITLDKRKEKFYLRIYKDHVVNRIGLTNKGFDHWLNKQYYKIKKDDLVIVSIAEKDIDSICYMVENLNSCTRIWGVEVNISCPSFEYERNIEDVILELENTETKHPIFLKIGNRNDFDKLVKNLKQSSKIEVININSYAVYDFKTKKWYGYSGSLVQKPLWNIARGIVIKTGKQVIIPSVWSFEDVLRVKSYFSYCNFAYGLASIILKNIFAVKGLIRFINSLCNNLNQKELCHV